MSSRLSRLAVSLCVCTAFLASPGVALADAVKTPTKAELGAMLKKCSEEADAKGLTVQMGKSAQRKAYRKDCMAKNGVFPRGGKT